MLSSLEQQQTKCITIILAHYAANVLYFLHTNVNIVDLIRFIITIKHTLITICYRICALVRRPMHTCGLVVFFLDKLLNGATFTHQCVLNLRKNKSLSHTHTQRQKSKQNSKHTHHSRTHNWPK